MKWTEHSLLWLLITSFTIGFQDSMRKRSKSKASSAEASATASIRRRKQPTMDGSQGSVSFSLLEDLHFPANWPCKHYPIKLYGVSPPLNTRAFCHLPAIPYLKWKMSCWSLWLASEESIVWSIFIKGYATLYIIIKHLILIEIYFGFCLWLVIVYVLLIEINFAMIKYSCIFSSVKLNVQLIVEIVLDQRTNSLLNEIHVDGWCVGWITVLFSSASY